MKDSTPKYYHDACLELENASEQQSRLAEEENIPTKADRHERASETLAQIRDDLDPQDERICRTLGDVIRATTAR